MRHLAWLAALLAAACSAAADEPAPDAETPQGKGDVFETQVEECEWGSPWGIETTAELGEFERSRQTFTEADIDELDGAVADQFFAASVELDFLQEGERLDLVFASSDDGELELIELTIDGRDYDWVRFFAGDTEVGVIFSDASTDAVAEISDGDLMMCEWVDGPVMSDDPICSADLAWRAGTSSALEQHLRSVDELDIVDGAVSRHEDQIVVAMEHLGMIGEGDDVFAAFDAVDDERIAVWELEFEDGAQFDWIRAFAGDTEIGMLFERARIVAVAEISDGDVLGCTYTVAEP